MVLHKRFSCGLLYANSQVDTAGRQSNVLQVLFETTIVQTEIIRSDRIFPLFQVVRLVPSFLSECDA